MKLDPREELAERLGLLHVPPVHFASPADVHQRLAAHDYLSDEAIASVTFLADRLAKPVLIEGPAGTGKTALAQAVADAAGARLIRLQCYEGLDESKALYEWNYRKQLLRIQAGRPEGAGAEEWSALEEDIFAEEFLLTRPLLEAIRATDPVVLLIDEVDRVELETEALLLEILSEYQVSIPELGTMRAHQIPMVFLTSNNTRELSEALKRRCLYLHIGYPTVERERDIILQRVPGISQRPGRADRARRAQPARDRPQEGAVGLRDPGLGAHPRRAGARGDRQRGRDRHAAHPAQVPERHRAGHQGAAQRSEDRCLACSTTSSASCAPRESRCR